MIYYYKEANEESMDLFQLEEVWQDGENVTNKVDLGKFFDSDKDVEKYITHVLGVDVIRQAETGTSPDDLDWEDTL